MAGTFHGGAIDLDCSLATVRSAYAVGDTFTQLTVGCTDTSASDTPSANLTISGETVGTYSDCASTEGDALLTVGVGSDASSCSLEGGTFDVELVAVDPVGTEDLHWSGTFHWEVGDTALNGDFDVTGSCSSGC